MQVLKLRSKNFLKLKEWLEKKAEKKHVSCHPKRANSKLIPHQILRDLTDGMRDLFYAIICNEYTDISNKEQSTLCLSWVNEIFNIYEDFLGFYELENIKSETIASAIRDVLIRTQYFTG